MSASAPTTSSSATFAYQAFLVAGVLVSFSIFGYAQEALTRGEYNNERFKVPTFLIVLQSFCNSLVAAVILFFVGGPVTVTVKKDKDDDSKKAVSTKTLPFRWSGGASPKDWSIVSGAYLGAHYCGLLALSYIPFPLQVVCKSCKAVPVMLGEKLIAGKKHSTEKQIQVLLMVAGVVAFTLAGGSSKKGGSADDFALSPKLFIGLGLVVGALICDGIYGPYQNAITNKAKEQCSSFHLMLNLNLYEFLFAVPIALANGELSAAVSFLGRNSAGTDLVLNLVYYASMMALGNVFLFNLQRSFGALTVTLTTTVRKLISVVFSVLYFGHSLALLQWAATALVFLATPISTRVVKLFGLETYADVAGKKKQ